MWYPGNNKKPGDLGQNKPNHRKPVLLGSDFTVVLGTGTQKKKSGFFFGLLRAIRPDVGPSTQQKLHIRKDHIQPKNFGKKKLSNRHAFTGELAVKLEHFWLL